MNHAPSRPSLMGAAFAGAAVTAILSLLIHSGSVTIVWQAPVAPFHDRALSPPAAPIHGHLMPPSPSPGRVAPEDLPDPGEPYDCAPDEVCGPIDGNDPIEV